MHLTSAESVCALKGARWRCVSKRRVLCHKGEKCAGYSYIIGRRRILNPHVPTMKKRPQISSNAQRIFFMLVSAFTIRITQAL